MGKYPANPTPQEVSRTYNDCILIISYLLFVAPAPVVRSTEPYAALLPAPLSPPNPQPGRIQQKGKHQNCYKR
jgi:hypothetical protein